MNIKISDSLKANLDGGDIGPELANTIQGIENIIQGIEFTQNSNLKIQDPESGQSFTIKDKDSGYSLEGIIRGSGSEQEGLIKVAGVLSDDRGVQLYDPAYDCIDGFDGILFYKEFSGNKVPIGYVSFDGEDANHAYNRLKGKIQNTLMVFVYNTPNITREDLSRILDFLGIKGDSKKGVDVKVNVLVIDGRNRHPKLKRLYMKGTKMNGELIGQQQYRDLDDSTPRVKNGGITSRYSPFSQSQKTAIETYFLSEGIHVINGGNTNGRRYRVVVILGDEQKLGSYPQDVLSIGQRHVENKNPGINVQLIRIPYQ